MFIIIFKKFIPCISYPRCRCPRCAGTGYVLKRTDERTRLGEDWHDWTEERCPRCGGEGVI